MKDACSDFQAMLPEYLDGELTAAGEARLRRHLAACPGCRQALREWRELFGLLELPGEEPGVNLTPAVLAAIAAEEPARIHPRPHFGQPWQLVLGLGMLLLLACALAGWFWAAGRRLPGGTEVVEACSLIFKNTRGYLPVRLALAALQQLAAGLQGLYLSQVTGLAERLALLPLLGENLWIILRALPHAAWGVLLALGLASSLLLGRLLDSDFKANPE